MLADLPRLSPGKRTRPSEMSPSWYWCWRTRIVCAAVAQGGRGTFRRAARGATQHPVKDSLVRLAGNWSNAAADGDLCAANRDAYPDATQGAVAAEFRLGATPSGRPGHRLKIRSITAVTREVVRAIAIRSPPLSTTLKISAAGAIESSADESPLRRRRSWASSTTTRGR
jgi:hypothetical protein